MFNISFSKLSWSSPVNPENKSMLPIIGHRPAAGSFSCLQLSSIGHFFLAYPMTLRMYERITIHKGCLNFLLTVWFIVSKLQLRFI